MLPENLKLAKKFIGRIVKIGVERPYKKGLAFFSGKLLGITNDKFILESQHGLKEIYAIEVLDIHEYDPEQQKKEKKRFERWLHERGYTDDS